MRASKLYQNFYFAKKNDIKMMVIEKNGNYFGHDARYGIQNGQIK